ncbi:MAG: folylpolyglutamate synthase/dihydrofolate synthase family protein [Thermodesulfobacteriota bacterium]|nr:folylpolyglutamate synthase/dihydrofolate synthase family protein [Thermodesulfobacteriota bacterium]
MQNPIQYLEGLKQRGINLGIGPISGLLARLDNPQTKYKTILIGGTNGKGSTAAILSAILMKEGMSVGLYTSPHLCDFRERIRINGCMIPEDALCALIDKARKEIKEDITYFEFSTALAFLYFSQCEVDIAVVEVGMGGRLDATNLVSPEVSVITNISLEHQRYLGDNLESIACEKGGIIKENGVCVTAAKERKVIDTLKEICSQRGSAFYRTGRDIRVRRSGRGSFSYYGINKRYSGLRNSLVGGHQIENAALALAVVDILTVKGMEINDNSVTEGLRDVKWEGRMELVSRNPGILVDGAHNPAGISSLCDSLLADFSFRRLIVVFGVLRDKDYAEMLKRLMPLADKMILTRPKEERAARTEDLLSVTSLCHDHVEAIDDSAEALVRARFLAGVDDLICVAGSLYLVGEIKKHLSFGLPEDRLL